MPREPRDGDRLPNQMHITWAVLLLAAPAAAEQWAAIATYDDTENSGAFIYGT